MTKRVLSLAVLALIFFACTNTNKEKEQDTNKNAEETILTVSQVMENPDKFLDKDIVVEGMVTHVCQHGGKRLHLSESGSEMKLRVRAGEETGKFERELEGSSVKLAGKFVEERIDEAYIEKLKSGQAEGEHEHQEGHENEEGEHQHGEDEHKHETAEKEEHEGQAQGVSEEFIKEMEAKIANSEKGYISEYWLESIKIEKLQK